MLKARERGNVLLSVLWLVETAAIYGISGSAAWIGCHQLLRLPLSRGDLQKLAKCSDLYFQAIVHGACCSVLSIPVLKVEFV